jgi:hypothetical protein
MILLQLNPPRINQLIGIMLTRAENTFVLSTPRCPSKNGYVKWLGCLLAFLLFPIPASVTPSTLDQVDLQYQIESDSDSPHASPRPPEVTARRLVERILFHLAYTEAHEANPHFRTDIRIAWIAVKWASDGIPELSPYRLLPPHVAATFAVLNCHPDEVWPRILQVRQEKLGAEYSEWYDASGISKPDIPKKKSESVSGQAPTRIRKVSSAGSDRPAAMRTRTRNVGEAGMGECVLDSALRSGEAARDSGSAEEFKPESPVTTAPQPQAVPFPKERNLA